MSELQELVSIIYHEKQESGSMLCAQHALNSLLQGAYFTAPDLSEIAHNLDMLEEQYNTASARDGSKNMDDTGFFSVQVMEAALGVWGLSLLRWRGSAMRPYQDHPHNQLAFILNLEQHWFTLRRFGHASANIDEDVGQSHWFNLNSFLSAPEWVGNLYLGMVLQQAETEGYSVFVVAQADASKQLGLPRTETDNIAATLPEVRHTDQPSICNATKRDFDILKDSRKVPANSGQPGFTTGTGDDDGVEDGDYELQAALQASLESQEGYGSQTRGSSSSSAVPPLIPADNTPYSAAASRPILLGPSQPQQWPNIPGHADLDPVAASMERNRVLLQRMREQQEYMHRELQAGDGLTPEEQERQEVRRQERRRREEEEEEQLKLAIAESEAMARDQNVRQDRTSSEEPPSLGREIGVSTAPFESLGSGHRNYDDEDAELQAALRASLENAPSGWKPSTQEVPGRLEAPELLHSMDDFTTVDEKTKNGSRDKMEVDGKWGMESEESGYSDGDGDDISEMNGPTVEKEQSAPPSIDEVRKARLARFSS